MALEPGTGQQTMPDAPAAAPAPAAPAAPAPAGLLSQVLHSGMGMLGVPYVWGGTSANGVDCSGLVQRIFAQHGVTLGRTTYDQVKQGKGVTAGKAQAGDILFFNTDSQFSHEGLYLGNGMMLVAPHTGTTVQIQRVNPTQAAAIRRVLPATAYTGLPKDQSGRYVYHPTAQPTGDYSGGTGAMTGGAYVPDAGKTATPKPLSVKQYMDDPSIAQNYGYLAAYLHDPEIGPILAKAAKGGWGENQLLGALEKTKWWKTTAQSARSWQSQQRLDPATAHQRLTQMTGQIQQLAQSTLGGALTGQRAAQIANTALAQNWSQAQLQSAVGAEFHYNAKQAAYGGLAGQTLDALKQHASEYLVPISDKTLGQWTQGVLKGTYKDTDFDSYLKAQAQSLYPTLKTALDSGVTVKQYLNPYAQMVQQTLGHNPDDINWMDPKWSKALNTTTPDGQRAPMSLSDWGSYLRGLPDYQTTDQAKQSASDLVLHMAQTFGKVAS